MVRPFSTVILLLCGITSGYKNSKGLNKQNIMIKNKFYKGTISKVKKLNPYYIYTVLAIVFN